MLSLNVLEEIHVVFRLSNCKLYVYSFDIHSVMLSLVSILNTSTRFFRYSGAPCDRSCTTY